MPETPTNIQHLVNLADARLCEHIGLMKPVMASVLGRLGKILNS